MGEATMCAVAPCLRNAVQPRPRSRVLSAVPARRRTCIGVGASHLGDRYLHLAEAMELEADVGSRVGEATELYEGECRPRREGEGQDRPEHRHVNGR
jgi:hypothetical protein